MKATALLDITKRMLDPHGDWNNADDVVVKQGDEVTFVYDETCPTELIIDIATVPGTTWLWTVVPRYWFENFDDVPTWSEVLKLLHDNGLTFSAEFDVYGGGGEDHVPVVALHFEDDDYEDVPPAFRAVDLLNRRWTGLTPVHAFDDWYVYITALPTVYSTDIDVLLGDLKTFFQENLGLLLLMKMVSPIEGTIAYNNASDLLRRLQGLR